MNTFELVSNNRYLNHNDHIIHDLKAPLSIIKRLQTNTLTCEVTKKQLSFCTDYIEGLIEKYFTKKSSPLKQSSSISYFINNKTSLFTDINFSIEHESSIDNINFLTINKLNFNRVLFNILSNAQEMFHENNTLNPSVSIKTKNDDKYFYLTISDNGCGFPPHILKGLKSYHQKHGRGIGLDSVSTILKESEGEVLLSNSKTGATISLRIPVIFTNAKEVILYEDQSIFINHWKKIIPQNITVNPKRLPQEGAVILMDINLGHECGLDKARELYRKGYQNIYLTTCYEKQELQDLHFIKGLIPKEGF